jgi:hypothetical protein
VSSAHGTVKAADVDTTLKPSGSAVSATEALRALGSGSTQAAAGDDSRFPTSGQKNALAGTAGTPGTGNEYVTTSDTRVTGAAKAVTPTAVKTANYTASAGDFVPVDCTSGSVTVTLPTAPADKTRVGVKLIAVSGANTVTIARGGTDVFNKAGGSTSLSLSLLNQSLMLQYAASSGIWYVQSTDLPQAAADARYAPIAHAANHASGGSDPVTIAESQVTNLTTDLAAKAPLASPTFTGDPKGPDADGGRQRHVARDHRVRQMYHSGGNLQTFEAAIQGGSNGGAGSGDGTTSGGGGGAAGTVMVLAAKAVTNSGRISANGGNGGTPSGGNCGGGGGGGGGLVMVTCERFSGTLPAATAGSGGTKTGTGVNGSAGSAGTVLLLAGSVS